MLPMKNLYLTALLVFSASAARAVAPGDRAPDFSVATATSGSRGLADFKGKVLLVNFWASWCAPCAKELPELNRLADEYKTKNFAVLTVTVDEKRENAVRLLAKLGLQAPALQVLFDAESKTVAAYSPGTMPFSFVVDPAGVVRFTHSGYHDADPKKWRAELDGLLK